MRESLKGAFNQEGEIQPGLNRQNALTAEGIKAYSLLMYAAGGSFKVAHDGHLDMVVSLMNNPGIDVNVLDRFNYTALHYAVENNHLTMLTYLLSDDRVNNSIKSKTGLTPLMLAIALNRNECAKILRDHGASEE